MVYCILSGHNITSDDGASSKIGGPRIAGQVHEEADIVKLLMYPKSNVYAIVKRYKEIEEDVTAAHKPKSDKIHLPMFVASLKWTIKPKPGTSVKKVAEARVPGPWRWPQG